jgi:hypothetical protein
MINFYPAVTHFGFFEDNKDAPLPAERIFDTVFKKDSTRYFYLLADPIEI